MNETASQPSAAFVKAAFGSKNRSRLIDLYFASQFAGPTPESAWSGTRSATPSRLTSS